MKRKLMILLVASTVGIASFSGCGNEKTKETKQNTEQSKEQSDEDLFEEELTDDDKKETEGEVILEEEETDETQEKEKNTYEAEIVVKDYGTITLSLDAETAPITVENFKRLAEEGFYDGLTFHRIIDGFMIQGGDPNGDGTGGSDENIKGEFESNGVKNDISHKRGVISMARSSDPDSASSQFFIMQDDADYLDGEYAAFGYVTDGMDVVDAICKDAKPVDANGTVKAEEQPVIEKIQILD